MIKVGFSLFSKKYELVRKFFFLNLNAEMWLTHCNLYDTRHKEYMLYTYYLKANVTYLLIMLYYYIIM